MARVTVEDCAQVVPNRYELVLLSAQRARDISAGAMITVDRDNDKNTVVALREIAEQTINLDELRRHIARGVNRQAEMSAEDDALLALASSAFGGADAALQAANAAFTEVEFEAEEAPESADEDEDSDDDDLELAGDDVSDDEIKAAMEALMQDMPEVEAEVDAEPKEVANS